jgi:predicted transcriptional regulator
VSAKLKKQALQILAEQPLTLKELSMKMDVTEKRLFKILRSLFQDGKLKAFKDEENLRRYRLL